MVAFIAEKHLSTDVRARVEAVLDNHSPVYYSNWLDNASHTHEYAYTKTWHYKNIDEGESYEAAPANPSGDVVKAITDITEMLREGGLSHEKEKTYLMMLIHLVGDLHQPMHMGHATDRGGNSHRKRVRAKAASRPNLLYNISFRLGERIFLSTFADEENNLNFSIL